MSNIPKARELLLELARKLPPAERKQLRGIVTAYMFREPPITRGMPKSLPVFPAIKQEILRLSKTGLHLHEIANRVGVNPGRVSEVLNGKR